MQNVIRLKNKERLQNGDSRGQWHHKGSECPSETKQPEEGFCTNQKNLITKAERSFWEAIKASLPENHYVFPQINSTAFIYKADDSEISQRSLLEMMKNSKHFGGNRYPSDGEPLGARGCACAVRRLVPPHQGCFRNPVPPGAAEINICRSTGTALPPPPSLPPYGANPSCHFPFPVLEYPVMAIEVLSSVWVWQAFS